MTSYLEFALKLGDALWDCGAPAGLVVRVRAPHKEDHLVDPVGDAWKTIAKGRVSLGEAVHRAVVELCAAWADPTNHEPGTEPHGLPGKEVVRLAARVAEVAKGWSP